MRRRERNRIAAQKVIDGREERKNNLVVEVKELEDEQSKLKTEVKSLQCIKEDCEFLLGIHRLKCDKSIKRKKRRLTR